MIHAEIDLPATIYRDVEHIAKASKREPEQVLRELIAQSLQARQQQAAREDKLGPLVGLQFHGPKDFALNIDKYLYDE